MIESLFFELLQVSIGRRVTLHHCPTGKQWAELFQMAKKQALVGVTASAIERLPQEQRPPKPLMQQWAILTVQVEQQNQWLNAKCAEVTEFLQQEGFDTCILKGQGMAQLYPNPLRRQSGDIDVWVKREGFRTEDYVSYGRRTEEDAEATYHHIHIRLKLKRNTEGKVVKTDEPTERPIDTEIHYRASWLFDPWLNKRLQRWFEAHHPWQEDRARHSGFTSPTVYFNMVYQLVHIFRHLYDEGIGLRQLMDYYFTCQAFLQNERERKVELVKDFENLGLKRLAGAVMYVLYQVFGMTEEEMVLPMDAKEGAFLLDEIMLAGNFGRYDPRSTYQQGESKPRRFYRHCRRNLQFLIHYPRETFFYPIWTIGHRVWRWHKGYL